MGLKNNLSNALVAAIENEFLYQADSWVIINIHIYTIKHENITIVVKKSSKQFDEENQSMLFASIVKWKSDLSEQLDIFL